MSNIEKINANGVGNNVPAVDMNSLETGASNALQKLKDHAQMHTIALDYAKFITKTQLCPDVFKNNPADAAAVILRGVQMGFTPEQALEAFFIVRGKTGMYARAMVAVAKRAGYKMWEEEATPQKVTWAAILPGTDTVQRVTWDTERVNRTGTKNALYSSHPVEMLRAKCQAEIVRLVAPEVIMGLVAEDEKAIYTEAKEPQSVKADATVLKARELLGVTEAEAHEESQHEQQEAQNIEAILKQIEAATTYDEVKTIMKYVAKQNLNEQDYEQVRTAANNKVSTLTSK